MGFEALVAAAHADCWQTLGELFAGRGGGNASFAGLTLMASGLPDPARNSGDVSDGAADVEAARAFYAAYAVPWGLRVPTWIPWSQGRRLAHQRLMGLERDGFRPLPAPPGVDLVSAQPAELADVLRIDSAAFACDPEQSRPWMEALLRAPDASVAVALARLDGVAVACGYAVSGRRAGRASVLIGGVAVLERQRRRGIGGALSSWLVQYGFDRGAQLAQLTPDDDRAARLYARLGFVETAGHDIYIEV
jgi:GNAT superfamily N-acetyltransferase